MSDVAKLHLVLLRITLCGVVDVLVGARHSAASARMEIPSAMSDNEWHELVQPERQKIDEAIKLLSSIRSIITLSEDCS